MGTKVLKSLLYHLLVILVLGCASKKEVPQTPLDPSPIDPKNPPTVQVEGLSDQLLVEASKSLVVRYRVLNYPMAAGWQKVAFRINNAAPIFRYASSGEITFPPGAFKKGANILRAYLLRSWEESLKNPEAYVFHSFYYGDRAGLSPLSAKHPILTLVHPKGRFEGEEAKKILFDFLVKQASSKSPKKDYKVRYSLNGKQRDLEAGRAVYFENLPPGKYSLRIDVLRKSGIPYLQELTYEQANFEVVEAKLR